MSKKTGEKAGAEEELENETPAPKPKIRFISVDAPLCVYLRAPRRRKIEVDGQLAVEHLPGNRVKFSKNFASVDPAIAERLRKCKRYGRDFMEVDRLMEKLRSGDRSVARFVNALERKRLLARLPQIVEKTVRLPAV